MTSTTGCPIKKFKPLAGGYHPENKIAVPMRQEPGCCGQKSEMPNLSVLAIAEQFTRSMSSWVAYGMPVATEELHLDRQSKCAPCQFSKGIWCTKCKCLIKLKTKLATEKCPVGEW